MDFVFYYHFHLGKFGEKITLWTQQTNIPSTHPQCAQNKSNKVVSPREKIATA